MEELDKYFKFKVGNFVSPKFPERRPAELDSASRTLWGEPEPVALHVIERELQECPGGLQRHYTCRGLTQPQSKGDSVIFGYTGNFQKFNEIEVIPYDEAQDAFDDRMKVLQAARLERDEK